MASGASGIRAGLFGRGLDFCGPPIFLGVIRETRGWSFVSISAAVSAYFLVRARPVALGMAYNSGSVGGIKFFPLWVVAISGLGFPLTAISIAVVMAATMWALAVRVFSCTPQMMGSGPEGDALGMPVTSVTSSVARPLPGAQLWRDRRFITLSAGMMVGLFAQIGLLAHLLSLLAPALGAQQAGLAMGLITVMAIAGRSLLG